MKFGIFYELQLPRPWEEGGEWRLYQNALDQVELADRLGYDYAWEVEHHFLEEYSHSPAPEVFLGAASQRTKRIRLCHGIMQLTTTHPARCAERIAALDLLSNGRVEFGTGESASITELEPFGVDFAEKRAIWEEAIRAISRCSGRAASSTTASISRCRCATSCRSRCSSRTRPCGSPARNWKRSRWRDGAASARSPSSSCRPTRRMPGCTPITTPLPSASKNSPIM
jgi:hypothetical protein